MKKTLIILATLASMAACKINDKKSKEATVLTPEEKEKALADTTNFTQLQWLDPTTKDLGKLVEGQSIDLTFRFKNTGNKNLIFENVWAQCGCTIPEKPQKAYVPGEEGVITAKYNGLGQGHISKEIYIKANIKPNTNDTLRFTGEFSEK